MRVAILSDIHANLPALEAVVADAQAHGATHLVCLGDIVGYGPQPVETLRRVREISNATVMGNHDAAACGLLDPKNFNPFARETDERAALALSEEDKTWLRELPYIIETKHIALTHGDFCEPEQFYYLESKEDAAVCLEAMPNHQLLIVGHTHIPCLFVQDEIGNVRKLPPQDISLRQGSRYVVNPGSVGFPRGDKLTADYILYDTTTRRLLFRALPYDLASYRLALVRNGYNPMNYWFLSPSARRRQTEQAFLNPVHAATRPLQADSPFRAYRQGPSHHHILYGMLAAFILLLIGALVFVIREKSIIRKSHIQATPPPTAVEAAPVHPKALSLPDLREWDSDYTAFSADGKTFQCIAATKAITSPEIPLTTPPVAALTLTFTVDGEAPPPEVNPATGEEKKSVILTSQVLFTRADGSTVRDGKHNYKTLGEKQYTVQVPADAVSLQLHYTFRMKAPFTFILPTLEVKE